ncbi:MAG: hypothetical protein Kow00107_10470 [Planctomycetota bacterium]
MSRHTYERRFAVLTPQGKAGVAVIALFADEFEHCSGFLSSPVPGVSEKRLSRVVSKSETIDTCLLCRPMPGVLELHLHGSVAVIGEVTSILQELGYFPCNPSSLPPFYADSRLLSFARTKRIAALLAGSTPSRFAGFYAALRAELESGSSERAVAEVRKLLDASRVAELIESPPRVLIAGPPNSGKSTIFNALLGYSRTMESACEGTTHDVVTEPLQLKGFEVYLSDSPGYGGADPVWSRTLDDVASKAAETADLVIEVIDLSTPGRSLPAENAGKLLVGNKLDIASSDCPNGLDVKICATSGLNIPRLADAIAHRLGIPNEDVTIPLPLVLGRSHRAALGCFLQQPSEESLNACEVAVRKILEEMTE